MAIFRKIHVSFWKDEFIESLTPEQKFFYLYLMTNDRTTQCGIYEITIKQICYDTGYNEDTVKKLIELFTNYGKIKYSLKTKEMALKNWAKYNDSTSPKVKSCINKELLKVKDTVLIQYIYSMHTHTQEEEEQEQEEEQEKEQDYKILFLDMIEPFKDLLGSSYNDFTEYWCEASKSGKLRYQAEKFFDVKRRINTWIQNKNKYGNTKNTDPTAASRDRMEKLQQWVNS